LFGAIFAGSSLIAPFFFGTVAGAIASGRVPARGYGDRVGSWINATSLVGGCLAVTTCVFLAGVFLTADADRAGIANLTDRLRGRTLAVGIVSGLIVFAGLYPVLHDSATLSHRLLGAALPLLVVAALAGALTLLLLYRRSYSMARFFAVAAVGAVIIGWGVAQYPWMLVDQLTINDAAGAHSTLTALLVVVALAVVIVLPPLGYLLWLTQTEKWSRT
jgi:cytochrome d ubiquinol oxidase subunit II